MRISQKTEWALIAALIAYIAFTPGFQVVRDLLSTGVGKAIALAAVVATWKYVSPLVAVLLTVSLVRCAAMREYLENPPSTVSSASPCPDNFELDAGQCKNKTTGQSIPIPSPPSSSTPPPTVTPPPTESSTTAKQPVTSMTSMPVPGGVVPSMQGSTKENFAPVE